MLRRKASEDMPEGMNASRVQAQTQDSQPGQRLGTNSPNNGTSIISPNSSKVDNNDHNSDHHNDEEKRIVLLPIMTIIMATVLGPLRRRC